MRHIPSRLIRSLSKSRLPVKALAVLALAFVASVGASSLRDGTSRARATAPVSSYTFGVENSWIRVQNIGAVAADVTVTYFNEDGAQMAKDECPSAACGAVGPGQGWTFFQEGNPQLPPGYKGSAVVESDQPIVALQAKDIRRNGAFMVDGNTTTVQAGASTMYLPLIANRDGPQNDWNGRFALQNLSDTVTACVTLTYLSNYTDGEIAWDPYKPGDKNGVKQRDCPNGGRPIAPRGTLFRDPDTFGLPANFTGSVRIDDGRRTARTCPRTSRY